MRIILPAFALLATLSLDACGPLNTDLHPLPTYRVRVTEVSAPPAGAGGAEVSISAVWEDGGIPFQVTWGFPADFERVLITQSTSQHSSSVTVRIPAGADSRSWDCDVTVADASPYRSTQHFILARLPAPTP